MVFGQSGGGAKIATLMAMPAGQGPVPCGGDDERAAGAGQRPRPCPGPHPRLACSPGTGRRWRAACGRCRWSG
jgi:hypothetical protein